MKRSLILSSLLLIFLLLFSYSYLPSENMNELYQKIPEQMRENSQLIAAYYSSQTGFDGFREYQFAFYNPKDRTLSIYTFKISKLLKIWPRMTEDKISCKTPFNYSVLATSPEKLKDFTNCNNCRILLYTGRIYKNEEIESIQPRLSEVLKANESYWRVQILGASELSTGDIIGRGVGDAWVNYRLSGYPGLLILPAGDNASRGVIIAIQPLNETHEVIRVHFPLNVTFEFVEEHYNSPNFPLWSLENLSSAVERLQAFKIEPKPWRWETSLSGKKVVVIWFSKKEKSYYEYQVYPKEGWNYRGNFELLHIKLRCRRGGALP